MLNLPGFIELIKAEKGNYSFEYTSTYHQATTSIRLEAKLKGLRKPDLSSYYKLATHTFLE